MHEMHEESEKGKIKNPYQVKDDWIRLKMKREEGFQGVKGFQVEREEREIEMFEMVQNQVRPQKYILKTQLNRSRRYRGGFNG